MNTATAQAAPRAPAATRARPASKRGWTVRISPDVDLRPIKPSYFKMAAILERSWRTSPHAFPSNATLAAKYGCTPRQAKAIIAGMEADGFIARVLIDPDRPELGRKGILGYGNDSRPTGPLSSG
jgi:hypothetical protein